MKIFFRTSSFARVLEGMCTPSSLAYVRMSFSDMDDRLVSKSLPKFTKAMQTLPISNTSPLHSLIADTSPKEQLLVHHDSIVSIFFYISLVLIHTIHTARTQH